METVLTFKIPSLLSFTAKGRSDKFLQGKYLERVKEDDAAADGFVQYDFNRGVTEFSSFRDGVMVDLPEDDGLPKKTVKAPPVFFESRHLFHLAFDKPLPKAVEIDHPMAAIADGFQYEGGVLWGDIDFINSPGVFSLRLRIVHADDRREELDFKLPVVSVKMNVERDYKVIKDDIQKASPGIVLAFLAKTFDDAGLNGRKRRQTDEEWFGILRDVFDEYERACKKIINDPHRRYVVEPMWQRADRVKRWTHQQANLFARTEEAAREIIRFRTTRIAPAIDTVENRFVLYTLKSLSRDLVEFAGKYAGREGVNEDFIKGIETRGTDLARLAHEPFFRGVGRFEGFRQQSLVLQRRPGYAQVLNAWLMLQQSLSPTKKGIQIGYRPISSLYEFWCFLEFRKLLTAELSVPGEEKVESGTVDSVLDKEELIDGVKKKTLSKLVHVWKKDGWSYTLSYQKTYGLEGDDRTFAIDYLQRPDIVLSMKEDASTNEYTYLFDSKYRISTMDGKDASPRDAIDEMHRYRDAILYRRGDGILQQPNREAIGAYVLFPGRSGDKSYEYAEKRIIENIGAIPLLPGADGEAKLIKFIKEILAKRTPESHLSADIPTRGTTIVVAPSESDYLATDVVYGTYRNSKGFNQLDWIKKNRVYNMPIDKAEEIGILDEASAKVKSMLFLVSSRREKPSVFRIKRGSAMKIRQSDLVSKYGYSATKPEPQKEYWIWELEIE